MPPDTVVTSTSVSKCKILTCVASTQNAWTWEDHTSVSVHPDSLETLDSHVPGSVSITLSLSPNSSFTTPSSSPSYPANLWCESHDTDTHQPLEHSYTLTSENVQTISTTLCMWCNCTFGASFFLREKNTAHLIRWCSQNETTREEIVTWPHLIFLTSPSNISHSLFLLFVILPFLTWNNDHESVQSLWRASLLSISTFFPSNSTHRLR